MVTLTKPIAHLKPRCCQWLVRMCWHRTGRVRKGISEGVIWSEIEREKEGGREGGRKEGREGEREREGGCCQRKMAAATSSLSWYTETTSRWRERAESKRERGRERKIRKMRADRERIWVSLWVFPERRIKRERERGDPGVGCCKRRATPSHGGRVSPYIFIFNIAHIYIQPSEQSGIERNATAISVTPTQHHALFSQSVLLQI